MSAAAGLLVSTVLGYAVVECVLPRAAGTTERALRLAVAFAAGLALASLVHLTVLVMVPGSRAAWAAGEAGMVVASAALLRVAARRAPSVDGLPMPAASARTVHLLRATLGAVVLLVAAVASAGLARRAPLVEHGFWDAWAMWNLRARFLHAGGEHWWAMMSPTITWVPPDYPLLLPTSVARLWTWAGAASPSVAQGLALTCSALVLGVLYLALRLARGPLAAGVGAVALLATPGYLEQSLYQVADLPIALFMLCACVCAARALAAASAGRAWALAGLLAGAAAWTKNEGTTFAAALAVALLVVPSARSRTRWTALAAGALPFVAVVVAFKVCLGGGTYLLDHASGPGPLALALQPARYAEVAGFAGTALARAPLAPVVAALVAAYVLAAGRAPSDRTAQAVLALALALQVAAVTAAYVVSPRDLSWHLTSSAGRVALQLWPAILFLALLGARSGEHVLEAASDASPPAAARAIG